MKDYIYLDEVKNITILIIPVKKGKPVKIAYEQKPITEKEYNEYLELVKKVFGSNDEG